MSPRRPFLIAIGAGSLPRGANVVCDLAAWDSSLTCTCILMLRCSNTDPGYAERPVGQRCTVPFSRHKPASKSRDLQLLAPGRRGVTWPIGVPLTAPRWYEDAEGAPLWGVTTIGWKLQDMWPMAWVPNGPWPEGADCERTQ